MCRCGWVTAVSWSDARGVTSWGLWWVSQGSKYEDQSDLNVVCIQFLNTVMFTLRYFKPISLGFYPYTQVVRLPQRWYFASSCHTAVSACGRPLWLPCRWASTSLERDIRKKHNRSDTWHARCADFPASFDDRGVHYSLCFGGFLKWGIPSHHLVVSCCFNTWMIWGGCSQSMGDWVKLPGTCLDQPLNKELSATRVYPLVMSNIAGESCNL